MKKIIYEKPSVMAVTFHYKPYLLAGSGETPHEETPLKMHLTMTALWDK